jgi:hypothetical protein
MRPLHELSLWQRIVLAIAIVLAAVLLLIVISWLAGGQADAQAPRDDLYADVPADPALLAIDKQSLTEAYHDQLVHLFGIWIKGRASSTKEITEGLKIARRAYGIAAAQIARREQQINGAPK